MGTPDLSVPPHAQPAVGDNRPRSGVVHDNVRHTANFTVVGNHLAQHPHLSLLAIGLGLHIQSVRVGTPVDIKSLAARFREGATRISAALRELEEYGYLRRERERASDGRIVTRTVSCNQPQARRSKTAPDCPAPPERPRPRFRRTGHKALPAVPQPSCTAPALLQAAGDLAADLRRRDSRLLFSATYIAHLVPGIAAWLERDVTPGAVRQALTSHLPDEPLRRPAALLAHRLAAHRPPPPPVRPHATAAPPPVRHSLRNCDRCDRGFRAPAPEPHCRDCRTTAATAHP